MLFYLFKLAGKSIVTSMRGDLCISFACLTALAAVVTWVGGLCRLTILESTQNSCRDLIRLHLHTGITTRIMVLFPGRINQEEGAVIGPIFHQAPPSSPL